MTLSEQLRRACRASRLGVNAIGRASGTSPAQVSRFLNEHRGLSSGSMDRIAAALGLELRPKARRSRKVVRR